jgi:hypothetical protein
VCACACLGGGGGGAAPGGCCSSWLVQFNPHTRLPRTPTHPHTHTHAHLQQRGRGVVCGRQLKALVSACGGRGAQHLRPAVRGAVAAAACGVRLLVVVAREQHEAEVTHGLIHSVDGACVGCACVWGVYTHMCVATGLGVWPHALAAVAALAHTRARTQNTRHASPVTNSVSPAASSTSGEKGTAGVLWLLRPVSSSLPAREGAAAVWGRGAGGGGVGVCWGPQGSAVCGACVSCVAGSLASEL